MALTRPLSEWPLLICGPMLRRVDPTAVSVFVALKHERDVALTVYDGMTTVAQGTSATIPLGNYLHATVVTATPTSSALVPGKIYTYDVKFTAASATDPLDTDRTVKTLASPNLAGPGSLLDGTLALGYAPNARPGFALPPSALKDLRLAHASCRKPHGGGVDALPILDTIIRESYANPLERPHQLFLTGDQIYADDVAVPLLEQLSAIGKDLLWDSDESVPPRESGGAAPTPDVLAPGYRHLAVKPPLTSDAATCHLIRLGEFYAMYSFAWSDALWGDLELLPPAPTPLPLGAVSIAAVKTYNAQVESLKHFRNALGKVRRALANVPTYMIFDDHEVTDDWYIHRQMREDVLDSPLGRRILTNGLCAYSVFQAWGNTPDQFSAGAAGGMFLNSLSQWRGEDSSASYGNLCAAVGTASAGSPPELRYDYAVSGPVHDVIVLDTRTRRAFPAEDDEGQADLLPMIELETQVGNRIPSSAARKPLTVLVSGAPVFGHPLAEAGQDVAAGVKSTAAAIDHETWLVTTRRGAFERLLELLAPCRSVLILSGDVHYGFTYGVRYWNERSAAGGAAAFVQLVSSALKNQSGGTKFLAGLPPSDPHLFLGWPTEGFHVRVTVTTDWWVPGNPAVYKHHPADFGTVDDPKWRYRAGFVADARLLEQRTGRVRPAKAPATTPFERSLAAALEQRSTAKDDQNRCVVGFNNLAIVRFASTPSSAARPMLLVQHTLWFRLNDGADGLPFTVHWADLTPPASDEPKPRSALPVAPPPAAVVAWENVISYRPPAAVQAALRQRGGGLRPDGLENASGGIRLDWYGVRVAVMPTVAGAQLDANALLRYFRLEIVAEETVFLDRGQARFTPHGAQDATTWSSGTPVGSVMDLRTKLGDGAVFGEDSAYNGTVVVGDATDHGWTFSSLVSTEIYGGPVTGNREFGYVAESASYVYFTRGAHRPSGPFFVMYESIHFKWADNYLRSMMAALELFVNSNGGTARAEPWVTADYGWASTQGG